MRCPKLSDLPPPLPGKTGWPWTVETPSLPDTRPDGTPWPRVSIVTPSYNQGEFIEETIRSVLLQGYPNVEYIIMDGGSTDASVDIIKKYERWIAHWESARDKGQADAINKGLQRSTGVVFQYINSDDLVAKTALEIVGLQATDHDAVAGGVEQFEDSPQQAYYIPVCCGLEPARMLNTATHRLECTFHQPGLWMKREGVLEVGGVDVSYRYCFDHLLAIKYLERWPSVHYTKHSLAQARTHHSAKSVAEISLFLPEIVRLREELSKELHSPKLREIAAKCAVNLRWRGEVDRILRDRTTRTRWALAGIALSAISRPSLLIDAQNRQLAAECLRRGRQSLLRAVSAVVRGQHARP